MLLTASRHSNHAAVSVPHEKISPRPASTQTNSPHNMQVLWGEFAFQKELCVTHRRISSCIRRKMPNHRDCE